MLCRLADVPIREVPRVEINPNFLIFSDFSYVRTARIRELEPTVAEHFSALGALHHSKIIEMYSSNIYYLKSSDVDLSTVIIPRSN